MPKDLRGLYAVLLVLALSAPTGFATSNSRAVADERSWPFAGALTDLLVRVFDRSTDGSDVDAPGVGRDERATTAGERDGVEGDDGPDADPAG